MLVSVAKVLSAVCRPNTARSDDRGVVRRSSLAAAVACLALVVPASASAVHAAYVANNGDSTVSAFSIGTNGSLSAISGSPFGAGTAPYGVAVTPDGSHLYISDGVSKNVSAFSIGSEGSLSAVSGSPFAAGTTPTGIAVTPDGGHLYVANSGSKNVSGFSIGSDGSLSALGGSPFGVGSFPYAVAVTPDGSHLYVANSGSANVSGFSIGSDGSLTPVSGSPFGAGTGADWLTVTPDGRHLYVANANPSTGSVSAFSIGSDGGLSPVSGSPFPLNPYPEALAVTPNGSYLYVAYNGTKVAAFSIGSDGGLTAVAGSPFNSGDDGLAMAVTPDGTHLYVSNDSGNDVSAFSIAAGGSLSQISGSPFMVGSNPEGITVTPDQGPHAAFSATGAPPGTPSSFDGSASSDSDGQVVRYDWDFGDGATLQNGGAKPQHTYANPGTYTVSLTATDDAGCSTVQVFTGQTASCNGGPSAVANATVTVMRQGTTTTTSTTSTPPVLSAVSESARKWREGSALPHIARKLPIGTTFRFTLSQAARVGFVFTQTRPGRRVAHRCVAQTNRNKHRPKCKRTVTIGTLSFNGHTGKNSVRFQGRISRHRKLKPGRYTLTITATNSVGQRSTPHSLTFTVVKK